MSDDPKPTEPAPQPPPQPPKAPPEPEPNIYQIATESRKPPADGIRLEE